MKKISSTQNSYIKDLVKLQEKSRERRKANQFIVEGEREIFLAQQGGYQIVTILYVSDFFSNEQIYMQFDSLPCIEVTREVYQKLAYRSSTEGIVAVVKAKDFSLQSIKFTTNNPLVLVLEGLEKPGNIGAILRTADASNVDAVFIADTKTDMYNPNIIRSSVGCVFTNQIAMGSSEEIINFLQEQKINIYSATLQNSNEYFKEDYTKPTAIVVGTEATGLTQTWRNNATQNINIPMQGKIDSMNVSVACAIITFEAKRQREFKN